MIENYLNNIQACFNQMTTLMTLIYLQVQRVNLSSKYSIKLHQKSNIKSAGMQQFNFYDDYYLRAVLI